MNKLIDKNLMAFSDLLESDTEFIPLLSSEDEENMYAEDIPESLPILPLRNTVLFPGVVIPITVGREKSIQLVKDSYKGNKTIGVVSQKDINIENPGYLDLNTVGTVAYIIKVLKMPDGSTTIIIQGKKRFLLKSFIQEEPYFKAHVEGMREITPKQKSQNYKALISSIKDLSLQIIRLSPNIPSDAGFAIKNIESSTFLVNFVASNLNIDVAEKQNLLEVNNLYDRANLVLGYLTKEIQMLELKHHIQDKVKLDLDKQQRDFFLSQQLKTIQEELGGSPNEAAILELQDKASQKKWSTDVKNVFQKEISKLQRMNPMAAEYSVQLNYLEMLVDLPWGEYTIDNFDLNNAQLILDEDHYGLEQIKERIIEHLAVYKLRGDMKSPILCLVGAPGVGKTSLGKSIARALGRKYIRMSLGGLRDEAEIRGHRKTYIGAMPGRILQNLKKAKSSNPVFVLDEVDKIGGMNVSGDPSAALLEVMDPEQNTNFYDNYLEMDFDLSKVMFIATANTLSTIHPALRDRMEIIDVNGYLLEEKIEIARQHLIPKQLLEHGIKKSILSFSKPIIEEIIDKYTRESGVRLLEKTIAKVIRNRAKFIVLEKEYNKKIISADLKEILGSPKFQQDNDLSNDVAGVATGLAWTAVGGEILFVEVSLSKGKGILTITGNLGEVMKESASIALEYLRSHSKLFDIDPEIFQSWNVHMHIPEGAVPKDGPSAGITMLTALASSFTQQKVRASIALTGEITLRGKVLPVGGIKEKILAAKRAKIKDIILSIENKKDIEEIPEKYIKGLSFYYVKDMIEVLEFSLTHEKVRNPLDL